MNNWRRTKGSATSNSYMAIHIWLERNYPKPTSCIRCGILGKKNGRMWSIEWALRPGMKYERVKDNFESLCRFCHRSQDHTPAISAKIWSTRRKLYGPNGLKSYV